VVALPLQMVKDGLGVMEIVGVELTTTGGVVIGTLLHPFALVNTV